MAKQPFPLTIRPARRSFERKGYPGRWVDKRLGAISARNDLTGEWFKRGATESEQFRELTNEMMRSTFGMDVESYRSYKQLTPSREKLRDHMSDVELVLTTLAEVASVELHRQRGSKGFEQLVVDVKDAGEIAADARRSIEAKTGRPVMTSRGQRIKTVA